MVWHDLENISKGFWVVSGARVGDIPLSGWYIMKANPKCVESQIFYSLYHHMTLRQGGWVWFQKYIMRVLSSFRSCSGLHIISGWYIKKVNPKCVDSQIFIACITIWHWNKMVVYDFESISQGFWVLSEARVGYIPFSGLVYYESQPKCL